MTLPMWRFAGAFLDVNSLFSTTVPRAASGCRKADARAVPTSTVVTSSATTDLDSVVLYSCCNPNQRDSQDQPRIVPKCETDLRKSLPHRRLPRVKLLKEIARPSVTKATFNQSLCPTFGKQVVNKRRNALEGIDPVVISAPEDSIFNICEFLTLQVREPIHEMCGVICGFT